LLTFLEKTSFLPKKFIAMSSFTPSIRVDPPCLQAKINLFVVLLGGALISRFEQSENSSIVFRGNPLFKREKGWHST
jgi:hypothetical protein